jgi:hypothetical protein
MVYGQNFRRGRKIRILQNEINKRRIIIYLRNLSAASSCRFEEFGGPTQRLGQLCNLPLRPSHIVLIDRFVNSGNHHGSVDEGAPPNKAERLDSGDGVMGSRQLLWLTLLLLLGFLRLLLDLAPNVPRGVKARPHFSSPVVMPATLL